MYSNLLGATCSMSSKGKCQNRSTWTLVKSFMGVKGHFPARCLKWCGSENIRSQLVYMYLLFPVLSMSSVTWCDAQLRLCKGQLPLKHPSDVHEFSGDALRPRRDTLVASSSRLANGPQNSSAWPEVAKSEGPDRPAHSENFGPFHGPDAPKQAPTIDVLMQVSQRRNRDWGSQERRHNRAGMQMNSTGEVICARTWCFWIVASR